MFEIQLNDNHGSKIQFLDKEKKVNFYFFHAMPRLEDEDNIKPTFQLHYDEELSSEMLESFAYSHDYSLCFTNQNAHMAFIHEALKNNQAFAVKFFCHDAELRFKVNTDFFQAIFTLGLQCYACIKDPSAETSEAYFHILNWLSLNYSLKVDLASNNNATPIYYITCFMDNPNAVTLLLRLGANVNIPVNYRTPLYHALHARHIESANVLIKHNGVYGDVSTINELEDRLMSEADNILRQVAIFLIAVATAENNNAIDLLFKPWPHVVGEMKKVDAQQWASLCLEQGLGASDFFNLALKYGLQVAFYSGNSIMLDYLTNLATYPSLYQHELYGLPAEDISYIIDTVQHQDKDLWHDSLLQLLDLLSQPQKYLSLLAPLSKAIEKQFPELEKITAVHDAIILDSFAFPGPASLRAFQNELEKASTYKSKAGFLLRIMMPLFIKHGFNTVHSFDKLPEDFLPNIQERERRMLYWVCVYSGVIPTHISDKILRAGFFFKEDPHSDTFTLTHGIITHLIQYWEVFAAIDQKRIDIPEGKSTLDFFNFLIDENLLILLFDTPSAYDITNPTYVLMQLMMGKHEDTQALGGYLRHSFFTQTNKALSRINKEKKHPLPLTYEQLIALLISFQGFGNQIDFLPKSVEMHHQERTKKYPACSVSQGEISTMVFFKPITVLELAPVSPEAANDNHQAINTI